MKNIGMDSEKLYQNTVNCIEFPQIPEGACHTPNPLPPPHYIIMQLCIIFSAIKWEKIFLFMLLRIRCLMISRTFLANN